MVFWEWTIFQFRLRFLYITMKRVQHTPISREEALSHLHPQIARTSQFSVLVSRVLERQKTLRRWDFQTINNCSDEMITVVMAKMLTQMFQVIQYLAYVAASKPKGSSHAPTSVSHQSWWKTPHIKITPASLVFPNDFNSKLTRGGCGLSCT